MTPIRVVRVLLRWAVPAAVGLATFGLSARPVAGAPPVEGPGASPHIPPEWVGAHQDRDLFPGISAPGRVATLSSIQHVRIARIVADRGAEVEAGDLLVEFDAVVERARTDLARAQAQSTLPRELAEARWQRAQAELDRLTKLHGHDYASSKELADARAEARIRRIEYDIARFELEQTGRTLAHEEARLAQLRLTAPFAGYVSERAREVGEAVEPGDAILVIAQLDPLRVLADCPLDRFHAIVEGEELDVLPVENTWQRRSGVVAFKSRVADAASQTFRIELLLNNADRAWPAGLRVMVRLPPASSGGPRLSTIGNSLDREVPRGGSDAPAPGGR